MEYRLNPAVGNDELNTLFAAAWPRHTDHDFSSELTHCLAYLGAYVDGRLVGFVKLAWDGGIHAFLLDPTVQPNVQRRGIGRRLVERAVDVARARGMEWVHVDYDPELHHFYERCGFQPTPAGLIRVAVTGSEQ